MQARRTDAPRHRGSEAARQRGTEAPTPTSVQFRPDTVVDFVVVGSGAAGGIIAKELATAGFTVVVMEQGPLIRPDQFEHDEVANFFNNAIFNKPADQPQTFRKTPADTAHPAGTPLGYHRLVGGGSIAFTANYWRLHEIDFVERTRLGAIPGADLQDWPITYADLEPYYTKAEWELGVSGQAGASPFDPPRSRPYPMPPLPVKSSGVIFERAARNLGLHPFPAPMAILSQPFKGRPPCQHCGFCLAFGCEHRAKSSTLWASLPYAEATGKCEVRPDSYVHKVEMDAAGRATGVVYFDAQKALHLQRARAVVLCCNGAETPRLLLMSANSQFPNGLANSSGYVGKNLMFNGNTQCGGYYEHELNEFKSVQVTRILHDFYDSDPARGFYGGGGIDARFQQYPVIFALNGLGRDAPQWGAPFKRMLRDYYTHSMNLAGHCTSLPVPDNSVSLDPDLKDAWGLPAIRCTYKDHPDDIKMQQFLTQKSMDILNASGARRTWADPVNESGGAVHLLGTCRMGDDPRTSVIDKFHRTHDVRNLFLCDGSSMVTGGRGQPTATIQALAFRAGELIGRFARRNEI